jgi:hypothetical protein
VAFITFGFHLLTNEDVAPFTPLALRCGAGSAGGFVFIFLFVVPFPALPYSTVKRLGTGILGTQYRQRECRQGKDADHAK